MLDDSSETIEGVFFPFVCTIDPWEEGVRNHDEREIHPAKTGARENFRWRTRQPYFAMRLARAEFLLVSKY